MRGYYTLDSFHQVIRAMPATSGLAKTELSVLGRRWRVVDGWLECEAMVGWKRVFAVADSTDLARRLTWLSGAEIVTANSLPLAA